ncbi:hypothetical protein F53441_8187 [Fusarium austroafricanum]|uniref:Uncharacterized protein n=1 Tax=Fusarium austroafricanum TaxID=2364996 RepID=A0A8H4NRE2_9HYPO|nr:hypothetical protein F53441_8187 [Fusarium austroafricanum]
MDNIPVEIRQTIFKLVIAGPLIPPSSPSATQHGRFCREEQKWESGLWEQRPENKALSLLLINKKFHAEVQDIISRLPENYHVDIMFVKDHGLWTTWDMPKRPTSRYVGNITATMRIFDPTDDLDDKFQDSLSFRGGCGGPESAVWAFYSLLRNLISDGPGYIGSPDGRGFIINKIDVNIIAPTDGAAHTRLEFGDDMEEPYWFYGSKIGNEDLAPEERLANYMTRELEYIFTASRYTLAYCLVLHEHIVDSILFRVNGEETVRITLDECLENCNIGKWQHDVNFQEHNAGKATRWLEWVTERRERMKKGLELDDDSRPSAWF